MSTCKQISTQDQHFKFSKVVSPCQAFNHVQDYFNNEISPLYGDQKKALDKIAKGTDRSCEILTSTSSDDELGIIVYKDSLSNEFSSLGFSKSFEIKTLFVINPQKNSGKRIATKLLRHIAKNAVDQKACSVFVTVSSAKPESLAFFLNYGFRIEKISKNHYIEGLDEYFLFHSAPQKLLTSITLELLAKTKTYSFSLTKTTSDELYFKTIEKLILEWYFQGESKSRIARDLNHFLGIKLDTFYIDEALSKLLKHNLKWQTPSLSKNYSIIFLNPLYTSKKLEKLIGYILVGITPDGERHLLGCCPAKSQPKTYWSDVFSELKKRGLKNVNIICGTTEFELPLNLQRIFSNTKIVYSNALRKWSPSQFLPKSVCEELIEELTLLNEISMKAQLFRQVSSL